MTDYKPIQLSQAQVSALLAKGRPDDIVAAKAAGQLDDLMGVRNKHYPPTDKRWSREDVNRLHAEGRFDEIVLAKAAGFLDELTGTETR